MVKLYVLCLINYSQVLPESGLEIKLSGSGATASAPTTLSPTMLNVEWRCEGIFTAVGVDIP